MEPHEAVILGLAVAGLLAYGVFLLVGYLCPPWPKGYRITKKTSGGTKVVVIFGEGFSYPGREALASTCAIAVDCAFDAWVVARGGRPEDEIGVIGVEFVSDEVIDKRMPEGVNGYRTTVHRRVGKPLHMAVIRGSLVNLVVSKGKPLIHEVIHALLREFVPNNPDKYNEHNHPVWDTVWPYAEEAYRERMEADLDD